MAQHCSKDFGQACLGKPHFHMYTVNKLPSVLLSLVIPPHFSSLLFPLLLFSHPLPFPSSILHSLPSLLFFLPSPSFRPFFLPSSVTLSYPIFHSPSFSLFQSFLSTPLYFSLVFFFYLPLTSLSTLYLIFHHALVPSILFPLPPYFAILPPFLHYLALFSILLPLPSSLPRPYPILTLLPLPRCSTTSDTGHPVAQCTGRHAQYQCN